MSQEFHVIRCFNCNTFQVHQVKKSKKWNCKLCGEKQSIIKVYAQGSGAHCRHQVQQLNMMRGGLETAKNELVPYLHTASIFSTSKHQDDNQLVGSTDGKIQHSHWTLYTEQTAEEEGCLPTDDSSSDVIYTTDRMLIARQSAKRKKKVHSSDECCTDDDFGGRPEKMYVNRSNKIGISSETIRPFTNFNDSTCSQYKKVKSKIVDKDNVKHVSSAIRNKILDEPLSDKYQQNIIKRNIYVKEISSEVTGNNKIIGLNKSNVLFEANPCIKYSPFDKINGSKTFYKFHRDTKFINEFDKRDQIFRLRKETLFPNAIKPGKTRENQPVKACVTGNQLKSTGQSKWSRFTDDYIDNEDDDPCGEVCSQEHSEGNGKLNYNLPEGEGVPSVLTYTPDLKLQCNLIDQENSNKSHMNSEYSQDTNTDVSIYHGKRNTLMSSKTFVSNCSKQSDQEHLPTMGCQISTKENIPNSKSLFTVGDISDDEFEL